MTLSESIKFNNGKSGDDTFSNCVHGMSSKFMKLKSRAFRYMTMNPYIDEDGKLMELIRRGNELFYYN